MKPSDIMIEGPWKAFYKVAAWAALSIVLVGILDIVLSMSTGGAKANSAIPVSDWFALLQTNPIPALSNLGMINLITLSLGIPVYLALFHVHQRANPAFASLAALLFWIGAAIYLSSNTIFSLLALSAQYAAAPAAEKPLLEAAGRAALALGADLTPGTLLSLCFAQAGGLLMALVMLRGGLFGKWTAWLGLFGFGCMLVFFPFAAFAPDQFTFAMFISMFGGLALMAYHILFARRLFQLAASGEK